MSYNVVFTYWWPVKSSRRRTFLLVVKTRQDLLKPLTSRIGVLNSCEVPEVIALPIMGGNPDYLT